MKFAITHDDISPALTRLIEAARNKQPVLRAMGTTFLSITQGNFNSAGASYRPSTWPHKKDGTPSILQKSKQLMQGIHLDVGSETVTVSTSPLPYAAIHQFGGKTAPHKIVPRSKQALAFGDVVVKSVDHPGSNIPPRPYFPITPEGKLTPKAEDLIQRAGERELAKQIDK